MSPHHFEIWDLDTNNLVGFFHSREGAEEMVADLDQLNPGLAGDLRISEWDYACGDDCGAGE